METGVLLSALSASGPGLASEGGSDPCSIFKRVREKLRAGDKGLLKPHQNPYSSLFFIVGLKKGRNQASLSLRTPCPHSFYS